MKLDLGEIKGQILVFGGVYSNFQALTKFREIADELRIPPSHIICTGDIVAYCAQPEACVQSIRDWGIHNIAGNVELQLRDNQDDCGCNFNEDSRCDLLSRQWYPYAREALSIDSIKWMQTLPLHLRFSYAGLPVTVVHGSPLNVAEYIFQSTPWPVKKAHFNETKSQVILAGHCGLPFHHVQEELHWLNTGVIGMPANDGTPRVWYMVLDDAEGFSFWHHSFLYDHEKAATLMEEKRLPQAYSKTLSTGIWDNCEILPEEEARMQGAAIEF